MDAWYFSTKNRSDEKLLYSDHPEIKLGVTHQYHGNPILYKSGLHASVKALDALRYSSGPILWKVDCTGRVLQNHERLSCTRRTYIAGGVDITEMLKAYARWCALSAVHLWECPDIVAKYLLTADRVFGADARRAAYQYIAQSLHADIARNAALKAISANLATTWKETRYNAVSVPGDVSYAFGRLATKGMKVGFHWQITYDKAKNASQTVLDSMLEKMLESLLIGDCWWKQFYGDIN